MLSFRKKILLLLIGGIGMVIISLGLLYYFQAQITKKVNLIVQYKKQLAARATIIDRLRLLNKESKEAQPYFDKLKQSLPSDTEMVGLEGTLRDLAKKNNLTLSFRFGLANSPQDEEPASYTFNLVLTGRETDIINWLDDFQKLPYSIRLEQIEFNLTDSNQRGKNLRYTVKIIGRIYLRNENVQGTQKK